MNEEIQKEILEILKGTKNIVSTQGPDAIQQYLSFEAADLLISGLLWLIPVIVLLVFFISAVLSLRKKPSEDVVVGCVFLFALLSIFSIIGFFELKSYYQIKAYPKGYLLKQATRCQK